MSGYPDKHAMSRYHDIRPVSGYPDASRVCRGIRTAEPNAATLREQRAACFVRVSRHGLSEHVRSLRWRARAVGKMARNASRNRA